MKLLILIPLNFLIMGLLTEAIMVTGIGFGWSAFMAITGWLFILDKTLKGLK